MPFDYYEFNQLNQDLTLDCVFMSDFWVFGYGSLIWNPGFPFLEKKRAHLSGLHRSLCVRSWVHRGTRDNPGLVLGLDEGGSCHGMAMRVPLAQQDEVLNYLRGRELVTNVYVECWRYIELETGEMVSAVAYRVDRTHEQYAPGLSIEDQTEIVRVSQGGSGHNRDYVINTSLAMREAGIVDLTLEAISKRLTDNR